MAGFAAPDSCVIAGQGVTGFTVIEVRRIPWEQGGLFPAVFGMTGRTLLAAGSMEPSPIVDAGGDLAVAGQALAVVDTLARGVTAIAAVQAFHILVGPTQRAGRNQRLESLRGAGSGEYHQ